MGKDLHNRGHVELPEWAMPLKFPYWRIRVEGRCQATRRRSYRELRRIRLSLIEQGRNPELVTAICRYLVSFKESAALQVADLLENDSMQLTLF